MPKLGRSDPNKSQLNYLIPTGTGSATPYGTSDTAKMKSKIVGGRLTMVLEDQKFTPRPEPPPEVRQKRTPRGVDFNPDKINTYPMTVYGYRPEESPISVQQKEAPTYRSRAAFSPHRVVPPIDSNSTESFEQRRKPQLEDMLLFGDTLPRKSIVMDKHKELELKRRVQKELGDFVQGRLRDVYHGLASEDRELTDLIHFEKMAETFGDLRVPLEQTTLALVAAQYIHETSGKIDYRKVLSFISGALKEMNGRNRPRDHLGDSQRRVSHDPTTSPQNGVFLNPLTHEYDDYGPTSNKYPYHDREKAKLLSMMEAALMDSEDTMMPMEDIWREFGNVDREHRNRLSERQIKDLTYFCKIPLQDQLINEILRHCQMSHDQYNWKEYLELIEKVRPLRTGYHLPESKKPTEYVKNMPKPSPNWPNAAEASPRKQPAYPPLPKNYVQPPKPQDYDRSQSKQSQVDMLDSQLNSLENKYKDEKRDRARLQEQKAKAVGEGDRWTESFKKLIHAMYEYDESSHGHLPRGRALWLINEYNDAYNMKIPQIRIHQAIEECTTPDGENVMIDSVLKILGVRDASHA